MSAPESGFAPRRSSPPGRRPGGRAVALAFAETASVCDPTEMCGAARNPALF